MGTSQSPRVSIVLPVCNGERYLDRCICSVLNQTFAEWELLISDDASTDTSLQIITRYTDSRIRIHQSSHRLGLFGNLNRLLSNATAPLVRFLCQDDILERWCLEVEALYLETNPEVVITYCGISEIGEHDEDTGCAPRPSKLMQMQPHMSLQMLLYYGCIPGNLSTVCVRRAAIEDAGKFDEGLHVAGDYEMWARVCRRGLLTILDQQLVRLRTHKGRLSLAPGSGFYFVKENRYVRELLLAALPPRLQARAKRYVYLRQNVLDTHFAVRCLLSGKVTVFVKLIGVMGMRDFLAGIIAWLVTGNNRFWRPAVRLADAEATSAGRE